MLDMTAPLFRERNRRTQAGGPLGNGGGLLGPRQYDCHSEPYIGNWKSVTDSRVLSTTATNG